MYYWVRTGFLILFDVVLINLSIYISLLLRFSDDGVIPHNFIQSFINLSPWFTCITLACLYFFRLYNRMWQYASLGELYGIIKAVITSNILVIILIYVIPLSILPRSVYILSCLFMFLFIAGSRLGWRILRDYIVKEAARETKKTLIIGAGDAGAIVARELSRNNLLGLTPIGFIDDNPTKQKLTLYGIPVLGNRKRISDIVKTYGIEEIIIAMPSAGGKTLREIINLCQQTPARVRIFQGAGDWLNTGNKIRDIELEDLLRREPVELDLEQISSYIRDKSILVSGAGGSIGSELCRQLCRHGIGKLILLDNSENNLFEIENELKHYYADIEIDAELCDVKDAVKLQQVFAKHCPRVVFHAAAYKHVPMMEKHPAEAVKNNVLGSKNIAEIADSHAVETFILI